MNNFSDADFQKTMQASIRLGLIFTAVGAVILFPLRGWQSGLMFMVGALISTTGVWEWRRLMSAVSLQMDNAEAAETAGAAGTQPNRAEPLEDVTMEPAEPAGKKPRMGFVLAVFFLRLGLTVVVLYVTLKYLQGSVFALAAGLLVGILALLIQALRLLRSWTA